MKITDTKITALMVTTAILWLVLIVCSFIGFFKPPVALLGLILGSILMMLYFIIGMANEETGIVPTLYPILLNGLFWIISFVLAYKYANFAPVDVKGRTMIVNMGVKSETFILGMHPGMFSSFIFFWIGNFITTGLGYFLFFKKHLPEEKWEAFMKEVGNSH